jgi:threonine dehydrogenase-like Zn-dependent dehydrogenase
MKALVYIQPGELRIQELPIPRIDSGQVLLRVRATGVCGSDLDGFLGRSKKRIPPLVLGHEFSGEVVETGDSATGVAAGQRVAVYPLVFCGRCRYCQTQRHQICPNRKVYGLDFHGALAEYLSAPETSLFSMPPNMSFVEGALVEPLANALHALSHCRALKGMTGVVFGAGPIGMFTLWAAKHLGADRVAVADLNPHRLAKLAILGADLIVDAIRQDPVTTLLDWTGGMGVDFAVDAVGSSECRANTIRAMAPGGTAVWIGLAADPAGIDGRAIVTREIEIKGSYAYGLDDFGRALSILAENTFPVDAIVRRANLAEGQSIFEDLSGGHTPLMKVIFEL